MKGAPRSAQARRLLAWLDESGPSVSPLLILTHDHPDPDALASAWALACLAQKRRIRTRIAYGGLIGRLENRIMAERLWIPAHSLRKTDLAEFSHTALVDTQPPFRNNRFPPRRRPDLIIDHHPRHPKTQADLALIDESVGATTTLLVEALAMSGLKVPTKLATALVYGIGSETQTLGREAGERDVSAYLAFLPKANLKVLSRIANPQHPASFFSTLAKGIQNAFITRRVIGVHLGRLPNPDLVAQIADFLLTHEKMHWSFVTGRYGGKLHVSLRTMDPDGAAGRILRRLMGGGNRGGGHQMIAGGSMEIGADAPEGKWRQAEESLAEAFLRGRGIEDLSSRQYPFRESF